MGLKPKDIEIINTAITKAQSLAINYYPQKYPRGSFRGERIIIPLAMFRKSGNYYLFSYWIGGLSASGKGIGYRLYFQKNIQSVRVINTSISFSNKKEEKVENKWKNSSFLKRWVQILFRKNSMED